MDWGNFSPPSLSQTLRHSQKLDRAGPGYDTERSACRTKSAQLEARIDIEADVGENEAATDRYSTESVGGAIGLTEIRPYRAPDRWPGQGKLGRVWPGIAPVTVCRDMPVLARIGHRPNDTGMTARQGLG